MAEGRKGTLFVFSGPSGVGKGTVKARLFEEFGPNVVYSVSATTRPPRESDVPGVDYDFITREEFERRIREDDFLEYAEYSGNYYGTPRSKVENWLSSGLDVLLEIEVQGAMQIMKKVPDCVTIFILPPSFETLEARLRGRGTETEEVIARRLAQAREEMKHADLYQYRIVNDQVDKAYEALRDIYLQHSQACPAQM